MTIEFLNKDVEAEIMQSLPLFVSWCNRTNFSIGGYDKNFEPLNDPAYVEEKIKQEAETLEILKSKMIFIESKFNNLNSLRNNQ